MIETKHTNELTFSQVKSGEGLRAALKMERPAVIDLLKASGLRGCGGAGFPVSIKWNLVALAKADEKYIICNADEGEPGTFKDRLILTDYADLLFEGMTIAAWAAGAKNGILYLRVEYTYLRAHLEDVLAKRREAGLLGKDIPPKADKAGFDFDIRIQMGAGAYVCGEETALIESLEGYRGEPRNRPPFPASAGYKDCPTVINNVETLAWVSCILAKGADWFSAIGAEKSKGPKLLSVSGDCDFPGVYEFPFGVTIAEVLETVGADDTKAVQVGGASGVCIPAGEFDRRIAFEDVATGGSFIVFGPDVDMLAVAENFLEFFEEESCGQCTPCREGNEVLLDGVRKLKAGECSSAYLKELVALAGTMQITSKCGLGQSSPNAFLSIVNNFKEDIYGRESLLD